MKFNLSRLRSSHQSAFFLLDVVMMILIIINLNWLLFDTLFTSQVIQSLLISIYAAPFEWYRDHVHSDYVAYDLIFVWIFLSELLLRWGISVYQREYHRWWFYPFIHWYDVLGCLPVGSFRFLRLFRIVSILLRLHKFGIIDLNQTAIARFVNKYLRVLVEEVSDRVVVNVLEGVKQEIIEGTPVIHRVVDQVLRPRERVIAEWLGNRMTDTLEQSYYPRVADMKGYIDTRVAKAIQQCQSLHRYSQVPVVGGKIEAHLYTIVSEVVFNVVHQLADDLHGDETTAFIQEAAALFLDHLNVADSEISILAQSLVLDVIDLVIEEVKIQKWKLDEAHV